jgi:nucleoside-diphosphate-sugar epimerase
LQQVPATEDHPRLGTSKRGVLRNTMEKMLFDAREAGEARVVIPRLAGFYGPGVLDSFLAQIVESVLAGKTAYWYGKLDVPYDLVFVEDAAEACVLLGNTPECAADDNPVWHVPGPGPLTGRQFIEQVSREIGKKPNLGVRSRLMIQAMGALAPAAKELAEVLYEFETPTLMDGGKLAQAFPQFQYTPHETAIPRTVAWLREYLAARPAKASAAAPQEEGNRD